MRSIFQHHLKNNQIIMHPTKIACRYCYDFHKQSFIFKNETLLIITKDHNPFHDNVCIFQEEN